MRTLFKQTWWKLAVMAIVIISTVSGLLVDVPRLPVLNETIRNLFYHVPMWFCMTLLLVLSLVFSILALRKSSAEKNLTDGVSESTKFDFLAVETARIGVIFGVLGFLTGTLWGMNTWGSLSAWLGSEPKVLSALLALLGYFVYLFIRLSVKESEKRLRISGVYNIFAFFLFIVFIYVVPRLSEISIHPGAEGNPAFSEYDRTKEMGRIFYLSTIGFIGLGVWIVGVRFRMRLIEEKLLQYEGNELLK